RRQNPLAYRQLEDSDQRDAVSRLKRQVFVAGDDHRAGKRREVEGLTALLVILDEFVDFLADDLPLIGFVARRNPPLEEIPIDLRRRRPRLLSAATHRCLRRVAVAEDLEPYELVDVTGRQRSLV